MDINPVEVYDQIAPRLSAFVKRASDVPACFQASEFADTVIVWAKELASMMVTPEEAGRALDEIAITSRFVPTIPDLMKRLFGDSWSTEMLSFPVPTVVWEEVVDISTGRIVEVYPCIMPGSRTMTRLEIKRFGCPEWDVEIEKINSCSFDKEASERSARRSNELGYTVYPGRISASRKANIRSGNARDFGNQQSKPSIKIRDDLNRQFDRFAAI